MFDKLVLAGQFLNLLLYSLDSPVIKNMVGGSRRSKHHQGDLHLQPGCRIAQRLTELVCPLPTHSPSKGIADVGAEYPEVRTILFLG